MKDWWIKFGCFLTGYNYRIISNCSEVAKKSVKRYTAAMVIICIIWSFIGFVFTNRYLHGSTRGSILGSVIMVIIVIQIERQIILSTRSLGLYFARGMIGILMAIIGAIIIDQIIFKEDIELEKITSIADKVKIALPPKTEELRSQIASLDTAIRKKEQERLDLINDIQQAPTSKVYSTQSSIVTEKQTTIDSATGKPVTYEKSKPSTVTILSNVANPKIALIAPLEQTIANLRRAKSEKEAALLNIRPQLEKEISSKVGFLDELEVMYKLITRSVAAATVWFIWFFFLLGLELLVLLSKLGDKENDYDRTVKHHMDLQNRKLEAFAKAAAS